MTKISSNILLFLLSNPSSFTMKEYIRQILLVLAFITFTLAFITVTSHYWYAAGLAVLGAVFYLIRKKMNNGEEDDGFD